MKEKNLKCLYICWNYEQLTHPTIQSPAYLTWLHECVSLPPVGTERDVLKVSEDSLKLIKNVEL